MSTTTSSGVNGHPVHAITVDVEDWLQSTVDSKLPLTEHFYPNTQRVLEAFAERGVRGTFYILGLAAEKAPDLVRAIHAAGHEVQSHGYGHELVFQLTPEAFRADLLRSKALLEDILGIEVFGYRAPAFSITAANLWALDVLVETGFRHDSSVFPVVTRRYGIAGAPWFAHRLRTPGGNELLEVPVASYRVMGKRLPVGGGGYFRLFPYGVIRRCIKQIDSAGQAAAIYMHPYEYNPTEFANIDYPISWKLRLHQGLGRGKFPGKVDRLLGDFRFGSVQDALDSVEELPVHEYRGAVG
jgi:polysaccharide deacetylase family protein (PEP-CTERM system associated)